MVARLLILGFLTAAVATLLDRGTLWEFTHDPDRRLTMTAYWTLHALLLVLMILTRRSLERRNRPTSTAMLGILAIAGLGITFAGLLVADTVALIRLAFVDQAPIVFATIIGAVILRMIWRMFRDPQPMLTKRDDSADQATWGDALSSIAIVPVAIALLFVLIALLSASWRTAELVLAYTLLGRDPTTWSWWYPLEHLSSYADRWEAFAFIGGIMILAIVLEKLFPKPAKPSGGSQ